MGTRQTGNCSNCKASEDTTIKTGAHGHTAASASCPLKLFTDTNKKIIEETVEKAIQKHLPSIKSAAIPSENDSTKSFDRATYFCQMKLYNDQRANKVKAGALSWVVPAEKVSSFGSIEEKINSGKSGSKYKIVKWEKSKLVTFLATAIDIQLTSEILKVKKVFYRPAAQRNRRQVDKIVIETTCKDKKMVGNIFKNRKSQTSFGSMGVDWQFNNASEQRITKKLIELKGQETISNWFLTPRAAELVVVKPNSYNFSDKRDDTLALRNPQVDVHFKPAGGVTYEKLLNLKKKGSFVNRYGKIQYD